MMILFNVVPLILVGTGVAILFWPRKPMSNSESLSHEEHEDADKANSHISWRRFLFATAFMALAFALAMIGQRMGG